MNEKIKLFENLISKNLTYENLNSPEYSWLKDSIFYESLICDDNLFDDNFPNIQKDFYCSKFTDNIKHFLIVIDYWGVNYYPKEFYKLLLDKKPIKELKDLIERTKSEKYIFLLELCEINILKISYLIGNSYLSEGSYLAAEKGFLEFLNFSLEYL